MLDYFSVSIAGSSAAYEEVDNATGARRFTDASGITVPSPGAPIAYQLRNWVSVRLSWMEPQLIPVAQTSYTQLEWLNRFTATERIAIRTAAKTNPVIEDALDLLDKASVIHTDSAQTIGALAYLVTQSLLTAARRNEILGII